MSDSGKLFYHWMDKDFDESLKFIDTEQLGDIPYDVTIIGAGVVGCALAYKLSMYKLRVLLLDKNYDVGEATSKGNSAIVHTGFDASVGTLESELVTKASREWPQLAKKLKIPYEECGALLIAINDEQNTQLDKVYEKALKNGVTDVQQLSAEQVLDLEPQITKNVLRGILIPRESIADPFSTSIAYAEIALSNGVDILFGIEVIGIENVDGKVKSLITNCGKKIDTTIIVNVAGLGSRKLTDLYGGEPFDINPRRGQFLIFDKFSRSAINHILLPIPTENTKGVLVIPTIFGNLIAGPSAEDFTNDDETVANTTIEKLQSLLNGASKLYPGLNEQPVIGTFSGVRCNCKQGSYWIRSNDGHQRIITVSGIRSTGFTSSPALAEYLIDQMQKEFGLNLEVNHEANDSRPDSSWPGWWKRPYSNNELVKESPAYGRVVCYCEQISLGEIIQHLDSPLKPRTLDAIKRRTRAQMGRCQGFDCMVNVAEIISNHCNIPLNKITKRGPGSEIISAEIANINKGSE
ncbi:MAG: NAD(P)/FAD-dependent oxidoreductase [Ignavibacteriaceae bacterium]